MQNYSKPLVLANEELAEGVYAASGAESTPSAPAVSDCWTATARIHQTPQTGRGDYRLQVDCTHTNPGMHWSSYRLTINFNQDITYVSCGASVSLESCIGSTLVLVGGPGNHNPNEHHGYGDLIVTSDAGLKVESVGIECTGLNK